jgi:hypothetical protein
MTEKEITSLCYLSTFLDLFDNISEGDIKGFVFQHNSEVYKFISAAVDLFD